MNNRKNRFASFGLLLLLVLLAVLAGACSGQTTPAGETGNETGKEAGQETGNANGGEVGTAEPEQGNAAEEGTVDYPQSLSYWVGLDANVGATLQDYSEVGVYKEIEQATGTTVEWLHPSGGGAQITEQFNLMLASRNLPDVIETNWLNVERGPDDAINNGVILRLNELMEQHAPNFMKYLEENPHLKKQVVTDEGNMFAFPFIRGDEGLEVSYGLIYRADWLEKLDLETPTTVEEWEQALLLMKEHNEGYPPFILPMNQIGTGQILIGAYGIPLEFYQDNGTVKYGSLQPEFKDFLTLMNRWYEQGLLDPDFAAIDGQLMDAKVTRSQLLVFPGSPGSGIGKYTGLMEDDPDFALRGAPYPVLNKGDTPLWGHRDFAVTGLSAAVTTAAEHPEQIVKWLDFGYSEQGHMLFNFGVEGESYEMIDGYPTYTDKMYNHPDGIPLNQALLQQMRSPAGGAFVQDIRYFEQYMELPEQREAVELWEQPTNEMRMPKVTLTAEEGRRFASIMSDLNVYREEMTIRFIMGSEPLAQFDTYVETLISLGIEEAIGIQEAALQRYLQR